MIHLHYILKAQVSKLYLWFFISTVSRKPGIFYFQTEGSTTGVMHTCIIHVRERQREYRVEILDRSFNSPIMVIEEGDRVWWTWNKEKVCWKSS